jgi:hypothetical protein
MGILKSLQTGSAFHDVEHLLGGRLRIMPADQHGPECRDNFHRLASEAIESAHGEGYEVELSHRSLMDPKGRLDMVIFKPFR